MKHLLAACGVAIGLAACTLASPTPITAHADETGSASTTWQMETFGPLAGLAGRSFAADGADGTPGDVQTWAFDLGGHVLTSRHVLTDGSYGGVTYIYANRDTGALDYVYVTTGGFSTRGQFEIDGGTWQAEEAVAGHPTIERVRSTGQFAADGNLSIVSEYLTDGAWTEGRRATYQEVELDALPALAPPA